MRLLQERAVDPTAFRQYFDFLIPEDIMLSLTNMRTVSSAVEGAVDALETLRRTGRFDEDTVKILRRIANAQDLDKDLRSWIRGVKLKLEALNTLSEEVGKYQVWPEETNTFCEAYANVYSQTKNKDAALQAAQGAVTRSRFYVGARSIKSADGTPSYHISGWGMIFTDGDNLDLQDTYFDDKTKTLLEYYPTAPLWMEHGQDPAYGSDPVGKRVDAKVYPHGVYVTHELHSSHPHFDKTWKMARSGKLALSSDSIGHHVDRGFSPTDGYLSIWPVAGWSLTQNPAEPGLGPVNARSVSLKDAVTQLDNLVKYTTGGAGGRPSGQAVVVLSSKRSAINLTEDTMDIQKLIDSLSKFLGSEAKTADELIPELRAFIDTDLKAEGFDPAELAKSIGLGEDATLDELVTKFEAFIETLTPAPARSLNMEALGDAAQFSRSAAERNRMPAKTSEEGERRSRKNVNVNRGAEKPGIENLIIGHVTGNQKLISTVAKSSTHIRDSAKADMTAGVNVTGGYLLNRELVAEIFQPLYAKEIVMALGATVVPMDGIETLTYRKMISGADAYWVGENQVGTDTNPTWGVVDIALKELVARTRISNRLLRSTQGLREAVMSDIIKKMRLKMDYTYLYGTGKRPVSPSSGAEPLGLINTPNIGGVSLATNGARPTPFDLDDAVYALEVANVEENDTWGWAMHARTAHTFNNMVDADGQPVLRGSWAEKGGKQLLGYNVQKSVKIPVNKTTGSSSVTSDIFFGDWSNFIIGMGQDIEIVIDTTRYINERETLIQAVAMADCGVAYPEAFYVIQGVLK
jgi:HK97 family phage major capsid protein